MNCFTQDHKATDSIRSYSLGEIVKIADDDSQPKQLSTTDIIPFRQIQKSDATSIADVSALIPAARLETNSRGETLLYLRNSGERQTALFFDGALLNIPWDNRMDLSFIPSDIIGTMQVAKGSSSILYGPNTMGGAVSLSSFERYNNGQTNILKSMVADGPGYLLSGTSHNRTENTNIIVHFNHLDEQGIIAPSSPEYRQFNRDADSKVIPNSYRERTSGYVRAETELSNMKIGIGLLAISGSKGVVPQDNREKSTRYWRYSQWDRILGIFNTEYTFEKENMIRATLWTDNFSQSIDKYQSITYDQLEETQEDSDFTYGGRIIWDLGIGDGILSTSLLGYSSHHNLGVNNSSSDFSQNTVSIGSEYRSAIEGIDYVLGGSFDFNTTPETGGFIEEAGNQITDYSFVVGLGYDLSISDRLFINLSRKNRFPTLREQYSDADRFVVNPDLRSEQGILSELGYAIQTENHKISIVAFLNSFEGLIEVRPVIGDSIGRNLRTNLDDALIPGIEIDAQGRFTEINMNYLVNLSFMEPSGSIGGEDMELETRPKIIGFGRLEFDFWDDFRLMPELVFNSNQYSYNDSQLVEIGFQFRTNLRASYRFLAGQTSYDFFARVDNITDESFLFKVGFPSAGRVFRTGLTVIL